LTISIRRGDGDQRNEPLIATKDILAYDWRTHEIVLTEDAWARVNKQVTMAPGGCEGLPFVVSVDGKAIYEGRFWSIYSCVRPSTPIVDIACLGKRKFVIIPYGHEDLVSSPEIFQVLKRHHILKNSGSS
jgi:hypothetical protein